MSLIPKIFNDWFDSRGWQIYPHQQEIISQSQQGNSVLLVAPTGSGKTLCGFLPSLIAFHQHPIDKVHTIYISPLKALAVDIARNLGEPVAEMGLDIRIETRTGDTPASKRERQRKYPPHFLLTTPESLEIMLAWPEADQMFASVNTIIIDEIHALAGTKRGDLLSLSLAALRAIATNSRTIALSATLA